MLKRCNVRRAGIFCGSMMILLGMLFLFRNMGYFSREIWNFIWPGVLILAGIAIIVRRHCSSRCCDVDYRANRIVN